MNIPWLKVRDVAWRMLVIVVAIGILVVATTRWNTWQGEPGWQSTDDAYLQTDITPVATKVAGYVRNIPVQDYQRVRAGDLVAQLVDDDYRAALAQAQANLNAAQALIGTLHSQRELQHANVDAARAVEASTAALIAQNDRDLARERRLLTTGSSSQQAIEKLETTQAQLLAQRQQNRAQVDAATRQISVLDAQAAQAAAAVAAQRANLEAVQINLAYTRVLAPHDGVLGQRQVKPGQYVSVGTQISTLTPLPQLWVIANFKETQLTHMVVGNKAEIRVDTFPSHTLHGHVVALAPASGSQFALLPPDNATGNFTKVVQRIAVKIAIDDADGLADRLAAGMSVIAKVDARDEHR
jgi:membrane fusion protein (multidrug efflux system)